MSRTAPTLTPAQVRWFRLRRSGLVEPFATPEETARRLLGVQAQLPPAAQLSFWNRTADCTADDLEHARLERRTLVRFWGQRNTVHLFACEDWPFLHAAFGERRAVMQKRLAKTGLGGDFRALAKRIEKRLADGRTLTYKDVKSRKLEEGQERWVVSYATFMHLVRDGVACHGPDQGSESGFVHRAHWLPDLEWSPPPAAEAFAELARRYLAAYGPAEPRDLAFWYDTNQTVAKRWLASIADDCRSVTVDGREHGCLAADLAELSRKPPPASRWPVRLLYRFDPLLLATKDKGWLIDEEHYKKVWLPSAHVGPVLLVHGRIAGTWRYDKKARGLDVRVRPFGKLAKTVARAAQTQAAAIAGFFGRELARFEVEQA